MAGLEFAFAAALSLRARTAGLHSTVMQSTSSTSTTRPRPARVDYAGTPLLWEWGRRRPARYSAESRARSEVWVARSFGTCQWPHSAVLYTPPHVSHRPACCRTNAHTAEAEATHLINTEYMRVDLPTARVPAQYSSLDELLDTVPVRLQEALVASSNAGSHAAESFGSRPCSAQRMLHRVSPLLPTAAWHR